MFRNCVVKVSSSIGRNWCFVVTFWSNAARPGRVGGSYNMAGCSKSNGHNMGYLHFLRNMDIDMKE